MIDLDALRDRSFLASWEWPAACESTNCLARTTTQSLPQLIGTDEQTAGRGRSGKTWSSQPGDLTLSIAFPSDERSSVVEPLGVGLAVARTCETLGVRFAGLKWPNDVGVLRGGRFQKLAGVLIESFADRIVVGIGLNLVAGSAHPDRTDVATETRRDAVSLQNAVEQLIDELHQIRDQSFISVLDAAERRNLLVGRTVESDAVDPLTVISFGPDGSLVGTDASGTPVSVRTGSIRLADDHTQSMM